MSKFVYVAGPLTGDFEGNTRKALDVGDVLLRAGLYPYVPHLSIHWHAQHEHDYETWMVLDFAWITKCDALIRMEGKSSGADREVELAKRLGIPVFYSTETLLDWAGVQS